MGSVVFKAESGRGGLAGWSQLVDPACSGTFFSQALPSLGSHPARIRKCEESSFLPACKFASLDSKNHCYPNI